MGTPWSVRGCGSTLVRKGTWEHLGVQGTSEVWSVRGRGSTLVCREPQRYGP